MQGKRSHVSASHHLPPRIIISPYKTNKPPPPRIHLPLRATSLLLAVHTRTNGRASRSNEANDMSIIAAAWRRNGGTRCASVLRGIIFGEDESGWACPWEGRRGRRRHSGVAAAAAVNDGRGAEMWGLKDYLDYRRSLYGGVLTHKALMVDAVGTLVVPSQPMAQVYREIGEKYGVEYSEDEILNRYRRAYEQPWGRSRLRYVNDGRPFWKFIVSSSTGCSNSQYFEELYDYYMTDKAWHLCDPEAEKVFAALRKAGVKIAVVSNFDTRLRPVLQALNCDHWFDAVAVSAEVEAEKPNPTIFLKACELLDVNPEDAVHVGDDRRNDIWGARDAGCDAWLWGSDVCSFKEVANWIGVQV